MKTYFKRLKAHPGVPVASLITSFMALAVATGENSPENFFVGLLVGAGFSMVFWVMVLWTARTQPLPREEEKESNMLKHSETPWNWCYVTDDEGNIASPEFLAERTKRLVESGPGEKFHYLSVEGEDGESYVVCDLGNGPKAEDNALFINTASHYHDTLVKSVGVLAEWLDTYLEQGMTNRDIKSASEDLDSAKKLIEEIRLIKKGG